MTLRTIPPMNNPSQYHWRVEAKATSVSGYRTLGWTRTLEEAMPYHRLPGDTATPKTQGYYSIRIRAA